VAAFPADCAAAGSHPPAITVEEHSQGIAWVLTSPARPGLAQVSLVLRDAAGNPLKQRTVTGDVWMPEMPMQGFPLELRFDEAEEGRYLALVQYGHGGFWQIRVMFADDSGRVLRQSFDLNIEH
jgi:nitrogen fixation protein FixH